MGYEKIQQWKKPKEGNAVVGGCIKGLFLYFVGYPLILDTFQRKCMEISYRLLIWKGNLLLVLKRKVVWHTWIFAMEILTHQYLQRCK